MKTKEEILDHEIPIDTDGELTYTHAEVIAAMDKWAGYLISQRSSVTTVYDIPKHILDAYAKQQAIEFGDWIKDNRWCYQEHLHEPSNWRYFNQNTGEDKYANTQDLYSQFIESQSKQP